MKILALSSSKVGKSGYLENAMPQIAAFLGNEKRNIAFIPFAFVDTDPGQLADRVGEAFASLPHKITTVTGANDRDVIRDADVIMVSGGNTFKLLHDLYATGLIDLVKEKVNNGTPYIGWSAGANITGATICTTNDMPIIEPESFNALAFFPFQINPHYYNVVVEGFNGETRDQRLEEYIKLNPSRPVVCLPEGTALELLDGVATLKGPIPGILLKNVQGKMQKVEIQPGVNVLDLVATGK